MFNNYKDVVTIKELKEMLNVGRDKAYALVNSGEIKSFMIGRVIKIPKRSIIDYVERQTA
ncbi:MAG TPA: hypothetical protein DEF42_17140 [Desulfosporosinus sp.]|nr:hypothetical protein [Desulfosporosinus sp.]